MNSKVELYRELCKKEPSIPLFSQAWWLDSTAGENNWSVALVEESGVIVASMPYVVKKKYGFTIITQPTLTQSLGPWLRPSSAKHSKQLSLQKKRIQELLSQLPKFDYFQQSWHPSITNWLPAYWLGFKQTTRYTYVINGISDTSKVLADFDSAYRNKIKKATTLVSIKQDLPIEKFYEINTLTFSRQKITTPYSFEFIKNHDTILAREGKRKIFYAEDSEGRIHSSLYLTWDANSAYVHMVGENPELRSSGAGILLIWEAIKYTSEVLQIDRFDFEGSMLESVEPVRRDCGGIQTPYFTIRKVTSPILKAAIFIKDLK